MEQKLRMLIGDLIMQNLSLGTQLEAAQARIKELEAELKAATADEV